MSDQDDPRLEPLRSIVEIGKSGLEVGHAAFELGIPTVAKGAAGLAEGAVLVFGSAVIMDGMGVGLPGVHTWPEDHAGHSGGVSSAVPASDPGDPAKLSDDYGSRPGEPGYADHSNPGMSAASCTAGDPALSAGHDAAASMSPEPHSSVDHASPVSDAASYFHH